MTSEIPYMLFIYRVENAFGVTNYIIPERISTNQESTAFVVYFLNREGEYKMKLDNKTSMNIRGEGGHGQCP